MSEGANEQNFVQRVQDAAEQLWLMRAWDYDRELEAQGWTTYYAIDADIFAAYGSVERDAQRTKDRPGYAEVFFDDPPVGTFALAESIFDHIFFGLQPDRPLLVIPPIDSEIRTMLNALTQSLGREPSPASVDADAVEAAIAELREINDDEPIPRDLLNQFSKLVALRGKNSRTEYRRLSNLLLLRRVIPTHSVEQIDAYPDKFLAIISKQNDVSEIYDFAIKSQDWLARLERDRLLGKSARRKTQLLRDAYALARLEQWNLKLSESRERIVYITGAPHIMNATIESRQNDSDFLQSNIRHPRYFLASPRVVVRTDPASSADDRASSQFYNWIVTFLADCRLEDSITFNSIASLVLSESLQRAAKEAFKRDPNLDVNLRTKWSNYLSAISASYVPPELVLQRTKEELFLNRERDAFRSWQTYRKEIDARIEEEKDRAWDDCFKTATRAGLFVSYAADSPKGRLPSRLVPPLRFDRWPKTEKFVKLMSAWRDPKDDTLAKYEEGLQAVRDETGADFQYAYYLAHAALFAARGDWRVGAILAARAFTKATDIDGGDSRYGHGREACYLAAYCFRHRAVTANDLEEAAVYLDRATDIFQAEIKLNPNLRIVPERFEAERLALSLTRLLRKRYRVDSAPTNDSVERDEWMALREEYIDLGIRLSKPLQTNTEQSNNLRTDEINGRLLARVNANILMISVALSDYRSSIFFDAGERLFSFLSSYPEAGSFYTESLSLLWRAAGRRNRPRRNEIRQHFDERRVSHHLVFPYDGARYKEIADKVDLLMRAIH